MPAPYAAFNRKGVEIPLDTKYLIELNNKREQQRPFIFPTIHNSKEMMVEI